METLKSLKFSSVIVFSQSQLLITYFKLVTYFKLELQGWTIFEEAKLPCEYLKFQIYMYHLIQNYKYYRFDFVKHLLN